MNQSVSVIIPVYNDPVGIKQTLRSICDQNHHNYKVYSVNNNSDDKTGEVIESLVIKHPQTIVSVVESDIQGSYAARNTGITDSNKTDLYLFLDADMSVPNTWIKNIVSMLESKDYDYLGCNVEVVTNNQPNLWERYEQSFSFPIETYLSEKHFAPTCALAVRREVFEEVGLFDEQLESGGDKEFGQRVHRAGFKQGYTENVTAYHPARDSWGALRSKAQRIGRGRAQMRHRHPEVGGYHHPLHPINYLPPSPFRLRRRFSGVDVSLPSLAGFYLLEYALKLIQSISMLRETLAMWRPDE